MPTKYAIRSRNNCGWLKETRLQGAVFGGGYKIFYTPNLIKAIIFDDYDEAVKTIEIIGRKSPLIADDMEVATI